MSEKNDRPPLDKPDELVEWAYRMAESQFPPVEIPEGLLFRTSHREEPAPKDPGPY